MQEETLRNLEESAGLLPPAPRRLQPVQHGAGGLPHPTQEKGQLSSEASHLVRSHSLEADKLKDQEQSTRAGVQATLRETVRRTFSS